MPAAAYRSPILAELLAYYALWAANHINLLHLRGEFKSNAKWQLIAKFINITPPYLLLKKKYYLKVTCISQLANQCPSHVYISIITYILNTLQF